MADRKIARAVSGALTITLASLATSATRVAGRESTAVDEGTTKHLDRTLSGKITTGTTPTVDKTIEIWVIPAINDTPTWPDVMDGTDSVETVTSRDILASMGRMVAEIKTDATSDRTYPFNAGGIAQHFGGILPEDFVIFVTHDTGVALNATPGNHEISSQGIFETIT